MKKLITTLLILSILGVTAPAMSVLANSNPSLAGNSVFVSVIDDVKELKKASKSSKKKNKDKEKNTKKRVKRLKELGVPKLLQKFGNDLSLREMGTIIAAWIVRVWSETGQLPTSLTSNPPDWLMLDINGSCISGPCDRWEE